MTVYLQGMGQDTLPVSEATLLKENIEYDFSILYYKPDGKHHGILYTEGLAKNDQTEFAENVEFVYPKVELYFYLPKYWDLSKPEYKWPVEWLDRIAMVPQKNKTWFGPGDTLPAGSKNPPDPINLIFKQNYFILSDPIADEAFNYPFVEPDVRYLAVIPIFDKEFEYKKSHSAYKLLEKFKAKEYTECLDEYREVIAKKRFFGLF